MSDQVFNPDDWNAAASEKVLAAPSPAVGASSNLPAILALVGAVEASAIDITPTYSDWLSIAFALVSELGEDGRSIFQRLSRFNPHYEYEETDRQYSHCLNDGSREITIASLFHIAHLHGVRWEQPRASLKPSPKSSSSKFEIEDGKDLRMSKSVKIDTFSQSIREQLPDILKRVVTDSVSDVDADLLILGSLTVFSACLPNVYGVYDRREVFSNLFLYVTARASAGKGRLSLCRHLVAPIHRQIHGKIQTRPAAVRPEQEERRCLRTRGTALLNLVHSSQQHGHSGLSDPFPKRRCRPSVRDRRRHLGQRLQLGPGQLLRWIPESVSP